MKVSYWKSRDKGWYVITQNITAENKNEKDLLKDCLTNYSREQNCIIKNRKIYSAWLTAVSVLRNVIDDKRILYRNTFFII